MTVPGIDVGAPLYGSNVCEPASTAEVGTLLTVMTALVMANVVKSSGESENSGVTVFGCHVDTAVALGDLIVDTVST